MVKDPGGVVKAMGNSLKDLERNYWSKADSVTDAVAADWFNIVPETPGNVIQMSSPTTPPEALPHETVSGPVADSNGSLAEAALS